MFFLLAQSASPWYFNPALLPAATGLLGVIVGGLITAGSAYLLDQRRETREREKEERDRAREIKRAARLLFGQLIEALSTLEVCIKNKEFFPSEAVYEPQKWVTHYPALAAEVSYEQWSKLVGAAMHFDAVIDHYRKFNKLGEDRQFEPSEVTLYQKAAASIKNAQEALGEYV